MMFGWLFDRYSRRTKGSASEFKPFCPKGDIDEWNYKEYLRILPLFEENCKTFEFDPRTFYVRLYAPNPSEGPVPHEMRGIHLITATKASCGEVLPDYEYVNILREVIKADLDLTAFIDEEKGVSVTRYTILGTGADKKEFVRPEADDYRACDIYEDMRFFPPDVFDKVELHPEWQPKERADLYKFDNSQFKGKTKFGFYGGCKYRGRVNGELADFYITTDRVKGKPDENLMWYSLQKIGDASRLYNSGRAHMRKSDDGESVVVDLSLDGRVIVDARDRFRFDWEPTEEESERAFRESSARWKRNQEKRGLTVWRF